MAKSTYEFDRWKAQATRTWAYSVFRKYDTELTRIGAAHYTASKFVYKALGKARTNWTDPPSERLGFADDEVHRYSNVKEWSDEYKSFDNWTNLNSLLTLASNFETYLAAVVRLSLESNPGIVLGLSQSIDGAMILKNGHKDHIPANEVVENCTRGEWSSRLSSFSAHFGSVSSFKNAHSDLEFIRKVRNDVGHAFGRDINQARKHGQLKKIQIKTLSHGRFRKLQGHLRKVVQDIDHHLLQNHIGEYEIVEFYSKQPPEHRQHEHHRRTALLKKAIGHYGALPRGKVFCSGLIDYWDAL